MDKWINTTSGVPIVSDFISTRGQGTPIVVDILTDQIYYLKDNTVTLLFGGGGWIPLVDGSEPPVFITDGAGTLMLVAGP